MLLRHFQVFFNIAGKKNYLFLFPSKTHKKFLSQEDKIGWFPSQLQFEQAASRKTTIFYIVHQNGRGRRPPIYPSVGGGEGGGIPPYIIKVFPTTKQARLEMLKNIINSKTEPSAVTHFPASSSELLLFYQPARFLWGTDKERNRFVGCPCILHHGKSESIWTKLTALRQACNKEQFFVKLISSSEKRVWLLLLRPRTIESRLGYRFIAIPTVVIELLGLAIFCFLVRDKANRQCRMRLKCQCIT